MFGKIVKSVFLTRDARNALERASKNRSGGASKQVATKPPSVADELRRKANATELDDTTIRGAIDRAHREIVLHEEPDGTPIPTDARSELMRSTLTVYRNKQKVLQELDPETLARLRIMAARMLQPLLRR